MADFGGSDLDAFRAEAREWLEANFPKSLAHQQTAMIPGAEGLSADGKLWKQRMADKGWGAPTWPTEYGGGGLSGAQARVLLQEMARIGAENPVAGMGTSMFGPTLLEYGSEAQKQAHIPRIARAEVLAADELLLSSATKEVLAITTLDDKPVGHGALAGKPGPVCAALQAGYADAKARA